MRSKIERRLRAIEIRKIAAEDINQVPFPENHNNGDEARYGGSNYIGSFSKGLPHDAFGEVDPREFEKLKNATLSGIHDDFENVTLATSNGRKLVNPQAGWGFDLQGGDPQSFVIPPAPEFASAEIASEMVELYWMALARDVCFKDFGADPIINGAVADLNNMTNYHGNGPASGLVNTSNIFRGKTVGDLKGPYLSQFLLWDIPFGTLCISQKQKTARTGNDYLTDFGKWLDAQKGKKLSVPFDPCKKLNTDRGVYEQQPQYIRNLRDLSHYVHFDALYQAYLNACLILLGMNAPVDKGNPYITSVTQDGFGTLGGPHILSLVTEVATRALKSVWHQKWNVNRRLRPEAMGGRVHNTKTNVKAYPIHADLLNATALTETFDKFGSYLLPQAFPEGSPMHPSYGAGHATVAGACVTLLKLWFDESHVLSNTVESDCKGNHLHDYQGGDVLTVGNELDKLAANISIGRNAGGVHYWTDYTASIKLGEDIAIGMMREQKLCLNESANFSLQKFDGSCITI